MKFGFEYSVFIAAFLFAAAAEIGCLSRTVALVARYGSPISVCLGTLLGNVAILIPVFLAGNYLNKVVPEHYARIGAGILIVILGILMILGKD